MYNNRIVKIRDFFVFYFEDESTLLIPVSIYLSIAFKIYLLKYDFFMIQNWLYNIYPAIQRLRHISNKPMFVL